MKTKLGIEGMGRQGWNKQKWDGQGQKGKEEGEKWRERWRGGSNVGVQLK